MLFQIHYHFLFLKENTACMMFLSFLFSRCGVRPFDEAREVLEGLELFSSWYASKQMEICKIKVECDTQAKEEIKLAKPDILDLCHTIPKEVINLEGGGKGYNVDLDADEEEYAAFKVSSEFTKLFHAAGIN